MRNLLFFIFSSLLSIPAFAQNANGLVARYSFNAGNAKNDVGNDSAKTIGIAYADDRFGNSKSACILSGSPSSYLNLGTSSVLKPSSGTISVWVMLFGKVYSGEGHRLNPIILTKSNPTNDYFEAYSIYYSIDNERIMTCCSFSKLHETPVSANKKINLSEWHHIVISYDDHSLSLYIDGVLQNTVQKNFRTVFLETDSVMVGYSANVLNKRSLIGQVDDICVFNRVLNAQEVMDLYHEPDPNKWRIFMKWFLLFLLLLTCIWIIVKLFTRKIKLQLMREKEKNSIQSKLYEMEMRVVKAQMNPHFIFNAMNSIQQFVLSNDSENANNYLIRFSRLLRKTLESNTDETISLVNEIDILEKYMEIEALRFVDGFRFNISCSDGIDKQATQIPQLLIQPLVENAIWHGLVPKVGDKVITITFELIDTEILQCTIDDNGIGRAAAQEAKIVSSRKSLGIPFIQQRLELLSKVSGKIYRLDIIDKVDDQQRALGTTILLRIPLHQKK
ncbi:MAG: histidine kinase [Bacteroidia bacterium]